MLWLVIVLSVLYIVPTFVAKDSLPQWYGDVFSKRLNFGLDLQGGLELRYTVDWKKAIEQNGVKLADSVKSRIVDELARKDDKAPANLSAAEWNEYASQVLVETPGYSVIRLVFKDAASAKTLDNTEFQDQLDQRYSYEPINDRTWELVMRDDQVNAIREEVVSQTRQTISKRVEAIGLVDPDVRIAGDSDVVVQIPGVKPDEMQSVRRRVGQAAQLTLRMVDNDSKWMASVDTKLAAYKADPRNADWANSLALVKTSQSERQDYGYADRTWYGPYLRADRKSELVRFVRTLDVPAGYVVGYEEDIIRDRNLVKEKFMRTQLVFSKANITGDHLSRAQVGYESRTGAPYVSLDFNSEGGRIFAELTEKNVKEYMAIMLDTTVVSAPIINEKIGGGRAQITMGGTSAQVKLEESRALTQVLNNGAYKAPVFEVHHHQVGPTLGKDSVSAGTLSMVLGLGLVIIFMFLYYRGAGAIAVTVLMLNMVFIIALLVSLNAALTLPGMAGIILTIGMAVDANIIIFERIREEAATGRPPRAAVDAGYQKALSTILDANITTALAGIILLMYTSGPIRGFAVTLLIGILCSVITAVYISRGIFNWYLNSRQPKTLSI